MIDYQSLIDNAMLGIIKDVLTEVEQNGLYGDQSFYIGFRTDYKGVIISNRIKQTYPKEITIVLQHQFRDLRVMDDKFSVNISFSGIPENIEVPFNAIISFLDPLANFGFQFDHIQKLEKYQKPVAKKISHESQVAKMVFPPKLDKKAKLSSTTSKKSNKEAEIIVLDNFRKKKKLNEENQTS